MSYKKLTEKFEQINNFGHLMSICHWDMAAKMPSGGAIARSKALADLNVHIHQLVTSSELKSLINETNVDELGQVEKSSFREMKKYFDSSNCLDESLVKNLSLAGSKCESAWREQRPNNDWKGFSKNLKEVIHLTRKVAKAKSEVFGMDPYDSLIDTFEPGVKSKDLDLIFEDVLTWLPGMVDEVIEKQKTSGILPIVGPFSSESQKELGLGVMRELGFDFNHGRLDESTHPFCGGVPTDVRITTRYDENDFMSSLMGVIHETGHARYEQNLPNELAGLPVAKARGMGIHESQSLFFEMQIGRDEEFIKNLAPSIQKAFNKKSEEFDYKNLYKHYTKVEKGLIRVDADELTYPLHIILRYQIEKKLVAGEIEVSDIPDAWDEFMSHNLGQDTKGNYKDGCMQDIHWTDGSLGYFPSYTLGAMYAAQYRNSIEKEFGPMSKLLADKNFEPIFNWLKVKIWNNASLFETNDLITKATGEKINVTHFKNHLKSRYL